MPQHQLLHRHPCLIAARPPKPHPGCSRDPWRTSGPRQDAPVAVPAIQCDDVRAGRLEQYEKLWQQRFGRMHAALYKIRKILCRMNQERIDGLVKRAAELPLDQMSLGQIVLTLLKNDPLLLLEARSLITTGLILK